MVNYRQHIQRIQEKIGETHSADGIEENSWFNVVIAEVNKISRERANELQNERCAPQYMKPYGVEQYERMPPMRILALSISLLSWLGWISEEKYLAPYAWRKISEAFDYGKNLSIKGEKP